MKLNPAIHYLIAITFIPMILLLSSCKKEEIRKLVTLNKFSKKFLPEKDTLRFMNHNNTKQYKIAIDAYFFEEVEIDTDSKRHTITASVEHYYKKYTSSTDHLIYHLYVIAGMNGNCDVMKITIADRITLKSVEIPFTIYQNNMECIYPLVKKSDDLQMGIPLIDSTYYVNYENYNFFLREKKSLLNYSFDDEIWTYKWE